MSKLDVIEEKINRLSSYPDQWVDGYYVMKRLGISKRTLQTYRSEGLLPYSQVRGIYFYKSADIDDMLERHYRKGRS